MTTLLNSLWRFGPLLSEDRHAVPVEPLASIFTAILYPRNLLCIQILGQQPRFHFRQLIVALTTAFPMRSRITGNS